MPAVPFLSCLVFDVMITTYIFKNGTANCNTDPRLAGAHKALNDRNGLQSVERGVDT